MPWQTKCQPCNTPSRACHLAGRITLLCMVLFSFYTNGFAIFVFFSLTLKSRWLSTSCMCCLALSEKFLLCHLHIQVSLKPVT